MGDVVAQQLVEKKKRDAHNWRRTFNMAAIGFCFTVRITIKQVTVIKQFIIIIVSIGPCVRRMVHSFG